MADEVFVLDADASGLIGAIDAANARVREARKALRDLGRDADKTGDEFKILTDRLNDAEREAARAERAMTKKDRALKGIEASGRLAGGRIGELTGALGDLGDIVEVVDLKTVAMGAAVGAVAAGFVAYGAAVVSVLSNLDEYEAQLISLEGRGAISGDDVADMREAQAALAGVVDRLTEVAVVAASSAAPSVTLLADAFAGLQVKIGEASAGWFDWMEGPAFEDSIMGKSNFGLWVLSLEEAGRYTRELAAAQRDLVAEFSDPTAESYYEALGFAVPVIAEATDATEAQKRAEEEARRVAEERRKEIERQTGAILDNAAAARQAAREAAEEARKADRATETVMLANRKRADSIKGVNTTLVKSVREIHPEVLAMTTSTIKDAGSVANAVSMSIGTTMQAAFGLISLVSQQTAEETRKSAKKRLDTAIAEATGKAIMASLNTMAQGTFPYNLVTAGLVLTAGMVGVGQLVKERNKLHSGGLMGLAPDETMTGSHVTRTNETQAAIITAPGMERQAIQDINAGAAMRASYPQNVYLVIDGRMGRARQAGRNRGPIGHRVSNG